MEVVRQGKRKASALSRASACAPDPPGDIPAKGYGADAMPPGNSSSSDTSDSDQAVPLKPGIPVEKRVATRREPRSIRAFAAPQAVSEPDDWYPQRWPYVLVAMIASILTGVVTTTQLPGLITASVLVLALVFAANIERFDCLIRQRLSLKRDLRQIMLILLPLFLFGRGMTNWATYDGLSWAISVAFMLGVSAMASVYLRRHAGMVLTAQVAMWSSPAMASDTAAGFAILAVVIVVALLVADEQRVERNRQSQLAAARERAQARAREILSDYEQTCQGWFWETDRRGLLTYVSAPVARAVGRTPEGLTGAPLIQLFDLADTGKENERTLLFHLSARSSFTELPVRAAIAGEERWWSVSGRPIYDSFNNFVGFRGSGTDLTARRRSQEEVSRLANYDSLTGLANRFQMTQALEKILLSPQLANRDCAIFLLDLDHFKHVNDTMGHPAGDTLLQQVADRLERAVGQIGKVGRLGGDEFEIILPGRHETNCLAELAREIIRSLSKPYMVEGQRVVIGASVGVSIAPDDGDSSETLIRNADLALYAAKDSGRGCYHFYADDLHTEAEARVQLEEDLRDAIVRGELEMVYQPVVSTSTEQITGFEALMRWHHPVKGWIPPQRFVSTAEDTGLIAQLGEWALRTACNDLAKWPGNVRMAVNVSPLQFSNPMLPAIVTRVIAQAGIAPDRLELEITESVFLSDDEGTDAMFAALKRIGVRLALDDFGTGYSSLGYLKKAPFDKIKIDQSFVRGATEEGSRNGVLIASISGLAQALGMETTAEGVETLDELDLVRMLGCSHVQGYIYERPLGAAAAKSRLETGVPSVIRGPRSARAARQTLLRKVLLEHDGKVYHAKMCNISTTGALIEGLWNVPVGTVFKVKMNEKLHITCKTHWSQEDRLGVEFSEPLDRDAAISVLTGDDEGSSSSTFQASLSVG